MIERREKKKLRMLDLEPVATLVDAALAQDEDLFPPP
jgi:hypothetical protein